MEQTGIMKAMLDLSLFTRYSTVLFKIDNLSKEMGIVLTTLKEYYDKYPECKSLSVDELRVYFYTLYPKYKDKEMIDQFFEQIKGSKITNRELLKKALNELAQAHMVSQIITEGISFLEEERPEPGIMEKFTQKIDKFYELTGNIENAESRVCTLKVRELLEADKSLGYDWRLKRLNEIIGPVKPGSLGHIFAQSEVGKSSLALAEATHFANQMRNTDDCILFLGNEEGMKRMKLRMHIALINENRQWIAENPDKADEVYDRAGGNKIKAIEGVNHIADVEMLINIWKPKICFIDQGTKVAVTGGDKLKSHEKLQAAYNIYRMLATKYDMCIITTGQADSASEHRKWLQLTNMSESKVGIPGELDFAIGITPGKEPGMEKIRFISVCKNKLTGMLGKCQTYLDIELCRYE